MRVPLTRDRVVDAAVAHADVEGVDSLSMRSLAPDLGVTPMAIYKHVAGKEDLLDAMIDRLVEGIGASGRAGEVGAEGEATGSSPRTGRGATSSEGEGRADWRARFRARVLAARAALLDHPWAPQVIESRSSASPTVLAHMDALMGDLLDGGLSADLVHHAMHVVGSRMWGFTQEVFPTPKIPDDPEEREAFLASATERFPHIMAISAAAAHDARTAVGCDDQFEFELALDLILDGVERMHLAGWSSAGCAGERAAEPVRE